MSRLLVAFLGPNPFLNADLCGSGSGSATLLKTGFISLKDQVLNGQSLTHQKLVWFRTYLKVPYPVGKFEVKQFQREFTNSGDTEFAPSPSSLPI